MKRCSRVPRPIKAGPSVKALNGGKPLQHRANLPVPPLRPILKVQVMGCGCEERARSLTAAAGAVARGDLRLAANEIAQSVKSLAWDIRSSPARQQMINRLARARLAR